MELLHHELKSFEEDWLVRWSNGKGDREEREREERETLSAYALSNTLHVYSVTVRECVYVYGMKCV